jgi:hypothetical protein
VLDKALRAERPPLTLPNDRIHKTLLGFYSLFGGMVPGVIIIIIILKFNFVVSKVCRNSPKNFEIFFEFTLLKNEGEGQVGVLSKCILKVTTQTKGRNPIESGC